MHLCLMCMMRCVNSMFTGEGRELHSIVYSATICCLLQRSTREICITVVLFVAGLTVLLVVQPS